MEIKIIVDGKEFRRYKETKYFVSSDGEIFSERSNAILKPLKRKVGIKSYYYIDIEGRHINVHRMVYEVWKGDIPSGMVVRHLNDVSSDNRIENLKLGTQKDNIKDCIDNEHRIGTSHILRIRDKVTNKILSFCPARDFIKYAGHSQANGSLKRVFTRKWFKERYEIIEFEQSNLDIKKSVTTNADECRRVG